jgi:HEAT repeat protein
MTELKRVIDELSSGDEQRAVAAVHELIISGEGSVEHLQKLFAHAEADLRWWALRAAAEVPSEESKTLLVAGLADEDADVRCCAALGLRHQPTPEAIPGLIKQLGSSNKLLARLTADALTSIGEMAVPELLEVMENGPQNARLEAVRALAHIGDQRSIPILFRALNEEPAIIEYWANEGLEKMGVGMVFFKP